MVIDYYWLPPQYFTIALKAPAQLGQGCFGVRAQGVSLIVVMLRRAGDRDALAADGVPLVGQLQRTLGNEAEFPLISETAMPTTCNEEIAMANGVHRCKLTYRVLSGIFWGIGCFIGCQGDMGGHGLLAYAMIFSGPAIDILSSVLSIYHTASCCG